MQILFMSTGLIFTSCIKVEYRLQLHFKIFLTNQIEKMTKQKNNVLMIFDFLCDLLYHTLTCENN